MSDYQQQQQEELHQRTIEALEHAKQGKLDEEDLMLLCWHAGIKYEEMQ